MCTRVSVCGFFLPVNGRLAAVACAHLFCLFCLFVSPNRNFLFVAGLGGADRDCACAFGVRPHPALNKKALCGMHAWHGGLMRVRVRVRVCVVL